MGDEPSELTPRGPGRRSSGIRSTRRARSAPRAAGSTPARFDENADAAPTMRLEVVEREPDSDDERRRQLWRDSATILIGVVLALLVGQVVFPPATGGPGGSPTPLPSSVAIGSVGPPVSLAPEPTFGPIVDPSLGIDATPTPIPVITMGPTPTPSPTPAPTPTRRPTPKPTKTPTKPPPTVTPRPVTPPPPTAPPPTGTMPPPTAPPSST